MSRTYFITGTGTGVGKTLVSAVVAEALGADYWKPVQAGFDGGTDSEWVAGRLTRGRAAIHPECYRLALAASPHLAAREEHLRIDIATIVSRMPQAENLVIEGAGGLMVPLNESQFVLDLILAVGAPVILVSRNELGSINHSLLTARACRQHGIPVLGWVFNDCYMHYEEEIAQWSGLPKLASIPRAETADRAFVAAQAGHLRQSILRVHEQTADQKAVF